MVRCPDFHLELVSVCVCGFDQKIKSGGKEGRTGWFAQLAGKSTEKKSRFLKDEIVLEKRQGRS